MLLEKVKNKLSYLRTKRFISKYEKSLQKRLKNDNFTILASNCAAGIIYNRLGKQFLSPTINMWFKQGDFIKFCTNLKFYLSLDLEFVESDEYDFPVAKLGDIYLYFNHSKTNNDAKRDWDRRKARVNYGNLFIIMYDRSSVTKDDLLKLNQAKCKNKVVFTADKDLDLDFAYYIKPNQMGDMISESYLDRDEHTLTTLEKNFDFVEWLNCSK